MTKPSETISSYVQSEIARGSFPGAQYLIGERGQVIAEDALGLAVVEPEHIPVTLDTIYDLASLTKPLITSLLVVLNAERGTLDLNETLAAYLTEFDSEGQRDITLTELLTHTSGLPNWRPLYAEAKAREEVPAAIARVSMEHRALDSKEVVYSDLNYILLGFVLERVTGDRLDHLATRDIFNPLGLNRTMFNPPADLIREIAATEHGQVFELANALADVRMRGGDRTTLELSSRSDFSGSAISSLTSIPRRSLQSNRDPWRTDVIWGEVHDGNAHFMGGVAGHAGLFSTAREVFRIANQFLDGSELLRPESLHLFRDNLTRGSDTSRSIAWIRAETQDCSAGPALSPAAIGHNGFTGSSVWMEPDERRVFILLTNRVHPHVDAIDMREIRRLFNTLAVEAVSDY